MVKHRSLTEIQGMLDHLRAWLANDAHHYGAHPEEIRDAAATIHDLVTWLHELAGRRRIST